MEQIKKLLDSPIYAMSLGSKELFHSNFWEWLIKQNNKFATVFFSDIDYESIIDLKRESRNRDLTLHLENGDIYIIENKIKSIPYIEQLLKYQKVTTNLKKGLLTGIKETLKLTELKKWDFLSYYDIAQNIRRIIKLVNIPYEDIVIDYCDVLELISEVVLNQLNLKPGELDYDAGILYKIKLDDIFKKFKAEEFLTKHIRSNENIMNLLPEGFKWRLGTDYSNKRAIIDIRFEIWDEVGFGIQIEGRQFRIIASRNKADYCEQVFKEFLNLEWFDDSYHKDSKKVFGYQTRMNPSFSKKYNKYETSWYSFVYQYFDITEEIRDFKTLSNLVFRFMKRATDIALKIQK